MECSKVKELLGVHKKEQLLQHKKPYFESTQNIMDRTNDFKQLRKSLDQRRHSTLDQDSQRRPMTIANKKKDNLMRNKRNLLDSTFQTVSRQ